MPDGIRWVGLDVHAPESTFAVFDQATGEVSTKRVVGRPHDAREVSSSAPTSHPATSPHGVGGGTPRPPV
jgi:hypothetical protein